MMYILNAVVLFFAIRALYATAAVVMLRLERHHNGQVSTRQLDELDAMLDRKMK